MRLQSPSIPSSSIPSASIEVEIEPARDCVDLATAWRALEQRADCSFFLSWSWIGAWLAELPAEIEPLCLRARAGGEIVGLALLTWRQERRHGVINARQLHLHATGHLFFDQLTIEYNDFLVDRRLGDQVRRAMIRALAGWPELWNELLLDGMNPGFKDQLDGLVGNISILQSDHPYVDFGAMGNVDCIDALGRNTRHQIRRTGRLCGDPVLERAADAAQGNSFFDGLVDQHRAIWVDRGKAGAFWNDFLMGFHHRLIAEGVPSGQVQLLRSRGGDGRIMGHLYNFAHRGRVYCYQSGFERYADNRIKPGLLTHHLAIVMSRGDGQRFYDFMAGDMRYKRSLSNRHGELIWILAQRPGLVMSIERQFRYLKRRLKAWLAKRNGTVEA